MFSNLLVAWVAEEWRLTKKLGSLLGENEDVSRRKQLATAGLCRLWSTWVCGSTINEKLRVRLYKAFILPILCHNCGTWGLTTTSIQGIESFHRRQLRAVIGVRYLAVIRNATLYRRTDSVPLRLPIAKARWNLFGHILRRDPAMPANLAMEAYFSPSAGGAWRGRPCTTLPTQDLTQTGRFLRTAQDLAALRNLARTGSGWRDLCDEILATYRKKVRYLMD